MALLLLSSPLNGSNIAVTHTVPRNIYRGFAPSAVRCMATDSTPLDETVVRRSANYMPSLWDHDYIQSLGSLYMKDKKMEERAKRLKKEIVKMLNEMESRMDQIELIDTLQRLGIAYHFEDEIEQRIKIIYSSNDYNIRNSLKKDLYATVLEFRVLRRHGFNIPQDIFNHFKDKSGKFKTSLRDDIKGILSLYEASYLSMQGETLLKEARDFSVEILRDYLKKRSDAEGNELLQVMVSHALEMPFHWTMHRLESRWYIDVYSKNQEMEPLLLEFAVLDFNIVQSIHQEDLKLTSSWWRSTGLGKKLNFARDRIMENYMWTVGLSYESQFGYFRQMSTKVNALVTIIDDIYDVYGTLEELELFTEAVERWDVNGLDNLPEYMRLCFLVLFNETNVMGSDSLRETRFNVIPCLKKSWADLCKAYLAEAKWYCSGYKPDLREYMENAWISISTPLILVHAFCFLSNKITDLNLDYSSEYHRIIHWSSTVVRLANDLGTSSEELKKGDVPKSIQCYMHETGVSESEAREHIKQMIDDIWDKMNEERMSCRYTFPRHFTEVAINLARMALCMYQYGDGYGFPHKETKDRVLSLFVHPIPTPLVGGVISVRLSK